MQGMAESSRDLGAVESIDGAEQSHKIVISKFRISRRVGGPAASKKGVTNVNNLDGMRCARRTGVRQYSSGRSI
jgi:hypothetical protein